MAGAKQVTYVFTFDGVNYGIKLPQGYYDSIDTKVGITEASDTNRPKFVLTKRQAVRNGALTQLGILYKKGTRLTRAKILCASAKLQSAISALEGDTYRGNQIHSAYIPMQRRVG
jgi:hypothetical protein